MRKNRQISWILTLVFMFSIIFSLPAVPVVAGCQDISGHWAESQIESLMSQNIINGYPDNTFRSENPISRAEFIVITNKAFNFSDSTAINYSDVKPTDWFAADIARAKAAGYISGYEDGTMKPNQQISRQEAASIVARILSLQPVDTTATLQRFSDGKTIANWSRDSIAAMIENGYLKGYPDNTFKPTNSIKRAEAAVLFKIVLDSERDAFKPEPKPEVQSLFDQAGTYGPETGTLVINKDVTISASGVTLQNLIIEKDLIIAKEVGDGDVTLNNVTVKGKTYVRGGGKDSIHINGGQYSEIIIEKTATGEVRIVAVDTTGLRVTISENAKGEEIILNGDFKSVTVNADDVNLTTQSETSIGELKVESGLKDVNIELAKDSTVKEIVLNSKTDVEGKGTIEKASGSKAKESSYATQPGSITTPSTSSGSGGGGGGGGGGDSTVAVSAISVEPTTMTLTVGATGEITATVEPSNASNKKVNWTTSDANVASVDQNGLVTAVAEGTATITATSAADSSKKASCVVTVAVPGTWKATGRTGFNTVEGTAYVFQEFELIANDERLSLHKDKVKSITVDGKALTPNTDETLWFNVLKATGDYKFVVVDSDGVTYIATLSWIASEEVTATKVEGSEGDHDGNYYQLYTVEVDVTPEDSKVYQIKPDGTISELTVLTDNDSHLNIWFRLYGTDGAQQAGNHIFLIKKGEIWSKAVISHGHAQATWKATGGVGTHTIDGTAYVFQGYELLDETNNRIDLVADNIAKMTVLDPDATEVKELTVGDDTDPLMWFNVRKASGAYKYTVTDKDGKVYKATLDWTAPAEVNATKSGESAYNAERGETYQLYTVEVDVTPADSKVYQIKPDGTISELTILTNNDSHLNIWFRLSGGVGPQQEGDHVFLIKKGETWSKAVINYKITEDSQAATALDEVNDYLTADNYLYGEAPNKLESHLTTLGLQVGEGSDYAALDKTADGGKNRKTAVFYDLNNNKPSAGYDLATLTTYFNDMVATRLVTQASMDKVNKATTVADLEGITYVTMLLDRFKLVSYETHSNIAVTEKIATLQGLVDRYDALGETGKIAVLTKIIETRDSKTDKKFARSQHTTDALAAALTEIETAINERLAITSVSIVDNKAYASTAAGEGNTVRVLGYGVGINLDAKSEGKTVNDTTSIVVELYKEGTLLGQQTFKGFEKHKDASSISGTIDAGGEYVATSWDNSWSTGIAEIPDKAVATVKYTDGTATAEKTLTFSDTKIFEAAEAVYALFANPFADAETLVLKEGVTQENITTASELVNAVSEGSSHKTLFGEMITKANARSGEGNVEQEANIEMMQSVPEKSIAEETLEVEAETEAIAEEATESDEATTDAVAGNEVNEEKITEETTVEVDETQLEGDKEVIEEAGAEAVEVTDEEVPVEGEEEVVEETASAEETIEEIQDTEEE